MSLWRKKIYIEKQLFTVIKMISFSLCLMLFCRCGLNCHVVIMLLRLILLRLGLLCWFGWYCVDVAILMQLICFMLLLCRNGCLMLCVIAVYLVFFLVLSCRFRWYCFGRFMVIQLMSFFVAIMLLRSILFWCGWVSCSVWCWSVVALCRFGWERCWYLTAHCHLGLRPLLTRQAYIVQRVCNWKLNKRLTSNCSMEY